MLQDEIIKLNVFHSIPIIFNNLEIGGKYWTL
jgi:hypothetical protein